MISRRDFLKGAGAVAGAFAVSGCGDMEPDFVFQGPNGPVKQPNILLILVDEMRQPPIGYGPTEGELPAIKEILRFETDISSNNDFERFFPGFMRLRKNATVLRRHYTAAAACAPSRTTFMTGQYPAIHGVTQVNGTFKVPDDIKFLDPDGVPTVGDWFRAGGYETHYFGKWHVSNTSKPPYDLEPYGFSSYETSGPDPDSSVPGLGAYRDPGFTEIVSDFFNQKAEDKATPWFAVASFANPHDTGAYPSPYFLPPDGGVTDPLLGQDSPQPIPPLGDVANADDQRAAVPLNPQGFPQQTFNLPPTWDEDLTGKPDCHLDSAWKMPMALAAAFPLAFQNNVLPYPTQALSTDLQMGWVKAIGQFYLYLQHLVNLEIAKILEVLDETGLAEDTMVVFTSDHGSNIGAHYQMVQKFFTGYEEATRVPFVISSPLLNPTETVRQVEQVSSHVDLAPTLLGLAGFSDQQIAELKTRITGHDVRDFVGYNLVPYLLQGAPVPRPGVLFTTSDDATKPAFPVTASNSQNHDNYDVFLDRIDTLRSVANAPAPPFPGPCVEPNAVHMFCTGEWKYSRYWDDTGNEQDQFEMYHLFSDPTEQTNLLDYLTGQLRPGVTVPGYTTAQLEAQVVLLRSQLAEQEATSLSNPATV